MSEQEDNGLTLEGLAQRLEALERENERISSENAQLRHKVATMEGSSKERAVLPAQRGSDTDRDRESVLKFDRKVSRRAMLSKAGAAAVAAVAAGTLLNTRQAKANHLSNQYFEANFIRTHYLQAINSGQYAVDATTDFDHNGAVNGKNDASLGVGVAGDTKGSQGTGVRGGGPQYGVRGVGYTNLASGPNLATGVKGEGDTGVWGLTRRGGWSGVYGQHFGSNGGGYGLVGDGAGPGYAGVLGRNSSGYGGRFEGGQAQLRLIPKDTLGPPTGAHSKGEIYLDSQANLFVCFRGGNPAEWRKVTSTAV
jgi:hypothetical protein